MIKPCLIHIWVTAAFSSVRETSIVILPHNPSGAAGLPLITAGELSLCLAGHLLLTSTGLPRDYEEIFGHQMV